MLDVLKQKIIEVARDPGSGDFTNEESSFEPGGGDGWNEPRYGASGDGGIDLVITLGTGHGLTKEVIIEAMQDSLVPEGTSDEAYDEFFDDMGVEIDEETFDGALDAIGEWVPDEYNLDNPYATWSYEGYSVKVTEEAVIFLYGYSMEDYDEYGAKQDYEAEKAEARWDSRYDRDYY